MDAKYNRLFIGNRDFFNQHSDKAVSSAVFQGMEPTRQTTLSLDNKRLITKKMTAQRLCVSTRTVDRMVADDLLEKVLQRGSVRLRERDIDEVVEAGL